MKTGKSLLSSITQTQLYEQASAAIVKLTEANTIEDLKGFNYEGYAFDANLSQGNKLVFTR